MRDTRAAVVRVLGETRFNESIEQIFFAITWENCDKYDFWVVRIIKYVIKEKNEHKPKGYGARFDAIWFLSNFLIIFPEIFKKRRKFTDRHDFLYKLLKKKRKSVKKLYAVHQKG